MKLSQKRNCSRCKGGYYEIAPFHQVCCLNFKVKTIKRTGIPLEPCYKPMTISDYIQATKLID